LAKSQIPNFQGKQCYLTFAPQNSLTVPLLIYFSYLLNKNGTPATFLGQIHHVIDLINNDKFKKCRLVTIFSRIEKDFYIPLKDSQLVTFLIDLEREADEIQGSNIIIINSFDEFKRLIK
jgi:hypothetical protein